MYKRCIISEPYWNNIGIIKVYETDEQECKPSYPGTRKLVLSGGKDYNKLHWKGSQSTVKMSCKELKNTNYLFVNS